MKARIVLVRHGEADGQGLCYGRRGDPPLSAAGVQQAEAAVARWPEARLVVSSPSQRARQTAALFGREVTIDQRFGERDFGEWEGRPWAELWDEVPLHVQTDAAAYAAWTPPGGEPLLAVLDRVWQAVLEWTSQVDDVLVVTSAGPLRLAVGAALGLTPAKTFAIGASHGSGAELLRFDDAWVVQRLGV